MEIIRDADNQGMLDKTRQWQVIEINMLEQKLQSMERRDHLKFLEECYPSLALLVLKNLGLNSQLEKYRQECKACEYDYQKYSQYFLGHFLPFLDQKRTEGKIRKSK